MDLNPKILVRDMARKDSALTMGPCLSATDRGSVTLLGAILIGIGLLLSVVVLEVGGLVAQRAHVSAAADAAALAAAQELALGHGPSAATGAAERSASANGAELMWCQCDGVSALVEVVQRSSLPGKPQLRAQARASVDFNAASP